MNHSVLQFKESSQLMKSYQCQLVQVLWILLVLGPCRNQVTVGWPSIYKGQTQVPVLLISLTNVLLLMLLFADLFIYN